MCCSATINARTRLNRTSVGLKLGIAIGDNCEDNSLNRTSVGLKQAIDLALGLGWTRPQSNQRGIETNHIYQ